jgi:16S rRNA (guanine1207-N2)-methyltransferase
VSEHYYSPKPSTAHDLHTIEETLRGKKFVFQTDAGVFSKKGVDFGSKLLIQTVAVAPTDRVLDVGCGYGPMGLAIASLVQQGNVTMVDINERAIQLAKQNATRNKIENVTIMQSDTLKEVLGQTFDVVVTNPPIRAGKEIVHRIFEEAHQVLVEGGALWVVIQKKQGAPSAYTKLESLFSTVEEAAKDKGYWILKAMK